MQDAVTFHNLQPHALLPNGHIAHHVNDVQMVRLGFLDVRLHHFGAI